MKKIFNFDELWPDIVELENKAENLVKFHEAKNQDMARDTLYSEEAVKAFLKPLYTLEKRKSWEHDIIALVKDNPEKIECKSNDGETYFLTGFTINLVWRYSKNVDAYPTIYFGARIYHKEKTVEVTHWQDAVKIRKFCEDNFEKLSNFKRKRAGKDGIKSWCVVPYDEWREIK